MVTNQLQYLPYADHILVLKGGAVVESGSYQQLMDQEKEFAALLREFVQEDAEGAGKTRKEAEGVYMCNKLAHCFRFLTALFVLT